MNVNYLKDDKISTDFANKVMDSIGGDLENTIYSFIWRSTIVNEEYSRIYLLDALQTIIKRNFDVGTRGAQILLYRWIVHSKLQEMINEDKATDPIFSKSGGYNSNSYFQFTKYKTKGNSGEDKDRVIQKVLYELNHQVENHVTMNGKKIREVTLDLENLDLKYRDVRISLSESRLDKLWSSYLGDDEDFENDLFNCLQRYNSIGGFDIFQISIPRRLFKYLTKRMKLNHECFASPLNHFLPSYSSEFYDVDKFFGSKGSFFDLRKIYPNGGSFQCNPPAIDEMIGCVVRFFLYWMEESVPISVVMFMPSWKDSTNYKLLRESKYNKFEHSFEVEKHRYEIIFTNRTWSKSIYNTTMVVLQNEEAAKLWPVKRIRNRELLEKLFR